MNTPGFALEDREPAGQLNTLPAPNEPAPIEVGEKVCGNAAPVAAATERRFRPKLRLKVFAVRRGRRQPVQREQGARYAQSNFLVGFAVGQMARAAGKRVARQYLG